MMEMLVEQMLEREILGSQRLKEQGSVAKRYMQKDYIMVASAKVLKVVDAKQLVI